MHKALPTSQSNENKLSKENSNFTKERLLDTFWLNLMERYTLYILQVKLQKI